MLYRLIRPLLFRTDPERAHDHALRAVEYLSERPALARAARQLLARPAGDPVQLMGLVFPHRVGLAAGFDKNARAPLGWWALGFGFIELGTLTPRPQPGHPRPRMFRIPARGALVNRMGFNNDGADAVAERLALQSAQNRRPRLPIAISVGKNASTPLESAPDDFATAAHRLAPYADLITMNVSSPNTPGLRSLQTAPALSALVHRVRDAAPARPVLVKVAPELEPPELDAVIDACMSAGAAGIIATNTLATHGREGLPDGGLSGRPLREIALRRVAYIRRRIDPPAVVIGCGGIDSPRAARAMRSAGADLMQIYTGLVYHGPFLAARLSRALRCLSVSASTPP